MAPVTMSYIGRKPGCGCVVAAVVDGRDKARVGESVRQFIADGLQVELVPSQYVRDNFTECTHPAPRFDYVARRPCGCVVAIRFDGGDADTAADVAAWIKDGWDVGYTTTEDAVRLIMLDCPHGRPGPSGQLALRVEAQG